ncbi:hypothetical protein [Halobacillus litoralis]|uniref:hypothetical protein n=1 Tax=Halobacillus litoralis TaxID=45668 RepID=UPI001CD762E8|nr:hypothetical protein [Halobacillus litoralis]MCA1021614.1 hypothetical protein [Halobacillus litoralis]
MKQPIDFYSLDIQEIEDYLKINHINQTTHDINQMETSIFDEWEDVHQFKQQFKGSTDSLTIFGYDLIHDNHFIKVYYKVRVSFT